MANVEPIQAQLHQAVARLQEREQQLAQAIEQNNNFAHVQIDLDHVRAQLEERDQQLAEAQLNQSKQQQQLRRQLESMPLNINDEFSRGRVPDLIKGLPQFNGNAKQLTSWTQSVERILKMYDHLKNQEVYFLWLQEIRNKITGEAGDILASNGTPLDWTAIKNQLTIIYGDKREMSTLLQTLFFLKQNHKSVEKLK